MLRSKVSARTRVAIALALPVVLFSAACGGGSQGGGGSAGGDEIPGITEELIKAAQEEGTVAVYGAGHTQETFELLQKMVQERFGVNLTYTTGNSTELANAINSQIASGKVDADVVSTTDASIMQRWAEEGVIADGGVANLDDLLEGVDDPANPQIPFTLMPLGIMYNTANTTEADLPATWQELSTGDFGKLVTADPNSSGTSLAFYSMMTDLYGPDWIVGLSTKDAIVSESVSALPQLVLTGEADLGFPAAEAEVLAAASGGEPLAIAYPSDGVATTIFEVAQLTDAPHPNAASLVLRYHVSEEFQSALAEEVGSRSVLEGVPPPGSAQDITELATLSVAPGDEGTASKDRARAQFEQSFRN
jgi:iron(III) transport system substrate-binding protein